MSIPTPSTLSTRSSRRIAVALLVAMAGVAAVNTAPAQAQQAIRVVSSGGPIGMGGGRPAMNPKELDNYAGILAMDDSQKEVAKELLTGYMTEFEKASKEQSDKVRQISEEYRETKDDEVWEQMGPVGEKFRKRTKELETALLNDLKAICSDQQLESWPKVERTRRRDRTLDRGSVSGESVDLVRVLRDFELTGEPKVAVATQVEAYEQDLDKALVARNKILDEQASAMTAGGRMEFDFEKFQKQMADAREAGVKVREVNQRYARAIESLLPDALRPRFQLEVKRASFPMVYRQTRTQRALEAALKFEDLDASQKEAIASLQQSYEHDAAPLNDKWASAIMEEEKEGGGGFAGGDGRTMMISFGNEDGDSKPSGQARKARREVDKKTLASLESLLTDAQKERLPGGGGDEAVVGGMPAAGGFIIGR